MKRISVISAVIGAGTLPFVGLTNTEPMRAANRTELSYSAIP